MHLAVTRAEPAGGDGSGQRPTGGVQQPERGRNAHVWANEGDRLVDAAQPHTVGTQQPVERGGRVPLLPYGGAEIGAGSYWSSAGAFAQPGTSRPPEAPTLP
ncbi:MAG: hypothetical protein JO352_35970 [Chloroflexi bacterium]|nr:hypothetical protein [Chloroflexota bacterium]